MFNAINGNAATSTRNAGTAAAYCGGYNSGINAPAAIHNTAPSAAAESVTGAAARASGRRSPARHNDGSATAITAAGNSRSASTRRKTALYNPTASVPDHRCTRKTSIRKYAADSTMPAPIGQTSRVNAAKIDGRGSGNSGSRAPSPTG